MRPIKGNPMLNKFLITIAAAGAMTLAAATTTYRVSLLQNSIIDGKQVKAGDYKLEMKDSNTAVLRHGKQTIDLPARQESAPSKFQTTELQYNNNNDLQEIRVGNTHTKIVFGTGNGTPGAGE
jgi:hypothetical protein